MCKNEIVKSINAVRVRTYEDFWLKNEFLQIAWNSREKLTVARRNLGELWKLGKNPSPLAKFTTFTAVPSVSSVFNVV